MQEVDGGFVGKSQNGLYARVLARMQDDKRIRVADAQEMGVSRKLLSNWAKLGKLMRVASGTYQLPSEFPDEMAVLSERVRNLVFSHESALYLNGLAERCPFEYSVTIPSCDTLPQMRGLQLKAYYIKDELLGVGRTQKRTPMGGLVACYDAERTICDILRSRSRVDEETIISALRLFARSPVRDLNRLSRYAQLFRIERIVHERLGALL